MEKIGSKLEEYSLLNKNFEVLGKSDDFEFNNPDAKYIVVSINEFDILWKDHEELSKLYDAGVDNWIGYNDALNDEED